MIYTTDQLDRAAAHLAERENAEGIISSMNWHTLAEISGESIKAPAAGTRIIDALLDAGRLVRVPSEPETYGHSLFRLVHPARIRDVTRAAQLAQLKLASPLRPPAGRTHSVDGLALFDSARQPRLL